MATKTASLVLVRQKLQITSADEELTDAEMGNLWDEAVNQLSLDKPLMLKETSAGNGNATYRLPSGWSASVSVVDKIEYPGGYVPKEWIDQNNYLTNEVDTTARACTGTATESTITLTTAAQALFYKEGYPITITDGSNTETFYLTADGNTSTGVLSLSSALSNSYAGGSTVAINHFFTFIADTPSSSDFFVLHYSGKYTLDDSTDTVPSMLYNPLINLTASLCAYSIAANHAKTADSTIGADIVDYQQKTEKWTEIGDKFNGIYLDAVKKGDSETVAAGVYGDIDMRTNDGRDFVFKNRTLR